MKPIIAVFIFIENQNNEIMFYEEQKPGRDNKLRLPGGMQDSDNETIEETSIREFQEEFNAKIKIEQVFDKYENQFGSEMYLIHLVKAFLIDTTLVPNTKEFVSEPIWVHIDEVEKYDNMYPDMINACNSYKRKFKN